MERKPNDVLEIETVSGERLKLSRLLKDAEFGGKTGGKKHWERQEIGLIEALDKAIETKSSVPGLSFAVHHVTKAYGLAQTGWEPYADIKINHTLGVSCKGDHAASLAGGGLLGLKATVPDLVDHLYAKVENVICGELGYSSGDITQNTNVPDLFHEIPETKIREILIGNEYIGGPVDYMYVGGMNVTYSIENKKLKLNGEFYSIDDYVKKINRFFFRVRKRDLDKSGEIRIDFETLNKIGYPVVYQNPVNGKNNFRLTITNQLPTNPKVIS